MRGAHQHSLKKIPNETQLEFAKLSRHRRAHLAEASQTTLVKASQWSRGDDVAPAVSEALEKNVAAHLKKKKA